MSPKPLWHIWCRGRATIKGVQWGDIFQTWRLIWTWIFIVVISKLLECSIQKSQMGDNLWNRGRGYIFVMEVSQRDPTTFWVLCTGQRKWAVNISTGGRYWISCTLDDIGSRWTMFEFKDKLKGNLKVWEPEGRVR